MPFDTVHRMLEALADRSAKGVDEAIRRNLGLAGIHSITI
jgi:hypothetical protein